jgi:hypothetical protein
VLRPVKRVLVDGFEVARATGETGSISKIKRRPQTPLLGRAKNSKSIRMSISDQADYCWTQ